MIRKKLLTGFGLVLLLSASLFAETGRDIMQTVSDKNSTQSAHSLVTLRLIDKRGSVSTRIIEMFSKKNAKDETLSLIIFHTPASVKNTRFLSRENKGRKNDQWIYLPALKRVRRIAASEGNKSFMGTDLTYDDMGTRDVDKDIHTLTGDGKINGNNCYVIESRAKKEESSQYSKRISWIDKNKMIPLKVDFYDKSGKLIKELTTKNIKKIQGHWTPLETTMKNVQTGHSTVIIITKIVYNTKLPDGIFTTRFLRTGRL